MKNELTLLGLAPVFGLAGAAETAVLWQVFAITVMGLVPDQLAVLACFVTGLAGPPIIWAIVWLAARPFRQPVWIALRAPASTGLGLVFATQLAFYIPIGFFTIAFHHGTLSGL